MAKPTLSPITAPATATMMTTASDNLLSYASTPPSKQAISPGKMNPRNVDASSAGIANTTSNAIHVGSRRICSTRPLMGNIFTYHTDDDASSTTKASQNVSEQCGMVAGIRYISVSSWSSTSRSTTGTIRGGMRAGEDCFANGPDREVHVHSRRPDRSDPGNVSGPPQPTSCKGGDCIRAKEPVRRQRRRSQCIDNGRQEDHRA